LLIEFQVRRDQRMAERMQTYIALLTEDLARQGRAQDVQILVKELNLWIESQSKPQLAETMRIVVLDRLRMNFPDLPAPQGGGLREVLDMFNQEQFKSYTDYLVFRASRREHIKGEWEGRRRGKQLGHKAGRQEGLQEGLQKGRQEVQEIVRLMLARSGFQPSGAASQRLEQADLATLKGWVEKLLANEVPPELKG
jgi:hypothetical protein